MSTTVKVIIGLVVVVGAFAFGRYTTPTKIKIETKTVEVIKTVTVKQTAKRKRVHKHTVVTETTRPDGTVEKRTEVVFDSDFNKDTTNHVAVDQSKKSDTKSETTRVGSRLNISLLAGAPVSWQGLGNFTYGVHVSRDIIGPFSLGAFGFSTGLVGISAGLTF